VTLHLALGAFIAYLEVPRGLSEHLEDDNPLRPDKLIIGADQQRNTIEKKIVRWRQRPEDWAFIDGLTQAFSAALSEPVLEAPEISRRHCESVDDLRFFNDICLPFITHRPDWPGEPIPTRRISISATMAALLNAEFRPKI
jgi:hypothetical protein